jgi:hypothetical protein
MEQSLTPFPVQWNKYLGQVWFDILKSKLPSKIDTIIEIAPGTNPKIGHALAKMLFSGTLYIVDPDKNYINSITKQYNSLIPNCTVIAIPKTMLDAIPDLPKKADLLISNHPLDDMLLNTFLSQHKRTDCLSISDSVSVKTIKPLWEQVAKESEKAKQQLVEHVSNQWIHCINQLKPNIIAISQYESWLFQQLQMALPDKLAKRVLTLLKTDLGDLDENSKYILDYYGFNAKRWLVSQYCSLSDKYTTRHFSQTPTAILTPAFPDKMGFILKFRTHTLKTYHCEITNVETLYEQVKKQYPKINLEHFFQSYPELKREAYPFAGLMCLLERKGEIKPQSERYKLLIKFIEKYVLLYKVLLSDPFIERKKQL